ncbi:MAG: 5-formyltetrahydrofolate cyclo-ligase [Halobacteria archaeon]
MEKQDIRESVWDELQDSGEARFPFPVEGRIPNFSGADQTAEKISGLQFWKDAENVKINPDSPQRPVRRQALREGKTLYVAVPRLAEDEPFIELDPEDIDDVKEATTIKGMNSYGPKVELEDMPEIDLVVSGSVAVTREGDRVGKGEGYSDLEFALLSEEGLVDDSTTTVTTVHGIQLVSRPAEIDMDGHDVPMDVIVTPTRVIEPVSGKNKPSGIVDEDLPEEKIEEIPVLQDR